MGHGVPAARARRKLIRTAWLGALIVMFPVSARADATILVGLMSVDGPRPSVGVAYTYCPSVAGFEIEYLGTLGNDTADHSSAGGIFGSLIVQPPTISNVQFFAIAGFGIWGETFANGGGTGELDAKNIGGGVKIRIARHLRLRLDYRLFVVDDPEGSSHRPSTKHPQRFSTGLQLVF
jgi:hypothetical protein